MNRIEYWKKLCKTHVQTKYSSDYTAVSIRDLRKLLALVTAVSENRSQLPRAVHEALEALEGGG